jgi:hypothetical protein
MGSENAGASAACYALIVTIIGAIYLSQGIPSGMKSYDGYLVGASKLYACSSSGRHSDCAYYVNERFLIDGVNSTAHCTVTRPQKYYTSKEANKKVKAVQLYTQRTVWIKRTNDKICFDSREVKANFAVGVSMLVLGCAPCLCFLFAVMMMLCQSSLKGAAGSDPVPTVAENLSNHKEDEWVVDVEMVPMDPCDPMTPDDVVSAESVNMRL